MTDMEQVVEGVAAAFRPLWEEHSRRLDELAQAFNVLDHERRSSPPLPRDLVQFARDVRAVLGLHDSIGVVALRERAATVEAMCNAVLND